MSDFRSSDSNAKVLKAMAAVRRQIAPIVKDQTDPTTRRAYASLPAIIDGIDPILLENGICPQPYPISEGDRHGAAIRFYHKSQEWLEFRMLYPLGPTPAMQDVSAAVTYARRAIYTCVFDLRIADLEPTLGAIGMGGDQPAASAEAPARQSQARTQPTAELINRAKDVERRLREVVGEQQASNMVIAEVGTKFLSNGDGRRIESFIAKGEALLIKERARGDAAAAAQPAIAVVPEAEAGSIAPAA